MMKVIHKGMKMYGEFELQNKLSIRVKKSIFVYTSICLQQILLKAMHNNVQLG